MQHDDKLKAELEELRKTYPSVDKWSDHLVSIQLENHEQSPIIYLRFDSYPINPPVFDKKYDPLSRFPVWEGDIAGKLNEITAAAPGQLILAPFLGWCTDMIAKKRAEQDNDDDDE